LKRFLLVFIPFLAAGQIFSTAAKAAPADNSSTPAGANSSNKPYGQYGSHLDPILKTINASPDQRVKISAVVNEFKPKIEPSIVKYREKRDQFLQSMISGKASEDIMSKQDEMNQLSSQINSQYMVMNLKVRRLLTPDQVEPYENYRKKQGWVK
jgi:Spy/CpxP family protein refolding chaperone